MSINVITSSIGGSHIFEDAPGSFATPAQRGVVSVGNGGFTGGSGHFAGSTSGTLLALNAASGATPDLIRAQLAGANRFILASTGNITMAQGGTLTLHRAADLSFPSALSVDIGGIFLFGASNGSQNNTGTFYPTNLGGQANRINLSGNNINWETWSGSGGFIFAVGTGSGLEIRAATVASSGSPTLFTITGPAYTTLAAATEASDANVNLARTVQFSAGNISLQRAVRFQAPTYAIAGAGGTITDAATMQIDGAPAAGAGATITRAHALRIAAGNVSTGGSMIVGNASAAPDQTLDVRGEISIFGSSASLARLRLRGFYTANPSDPPIDQSDIFIFDDGVTIQLRVRYNDAGVVKQGTIVLS